MPRPPSSMGSSAGHATTFPSADAKMKGNGLASSRRRRPSSAAGKKRRKSGKRRSRHSPPEKRQRQRHDEETTRSSPSGDVEFKAGRTVRFQKDGKNLQGQMEAEEKDGRILVRYTVEEPDRKVARREKLPRASLSTVVSSSSSGSSEDESFSSSSTSSASSSSSSSSSSSDSSSAEVEAALSETEAPQRRPQNVESSRGDKEKTTLGKIEISGKEKTLEVENAKQERAPDTAEADSTKQLRASGEEAAASEALDAQSTASASTDAGSDGESSSGSYSFPEVDDGPSEDVGARSRQDSKTQDLAQHEPRDAALAVSSFKTQMNSTKSKSPQKDCSPGSGGSTLRKRDDDNPNQVPAKRDSIAPTVSIGGMIFAPDSPSQSAASGYFSAKYDFTRLISEQFNPGGGDDKKVEEGVGTMRVYEEALLKAEEVLESADSTGNTRPMSVVKAFQAVRQAASIAKADMSSHTKRSIKVDNDRFWLEDCYKALQERDRDLAEKKNLYQKKKKASSAPKTTSAPVAPVVRSERPCVRCKISTLATDWVAVCEQCITELAAEFRLLCMDSKLSIADRAACGAMMDLLRMPSIVDFIFLPTDPVYQFSTEDQKLYNGRVKRPTSVLVALDLAKQIAEGKGSASLTEEMRRIFSNAKQFSPSSDYVRETVSPLADAFAKSLKAWESALAKSERNHEISDNVVTGKIDTPVSARAGDLSPVSPTLVTQQREQLAQQQAQIAILQGQIVSLSQQAATASNSLKLLNDANDKVSSFLNDVLRHKIELEQAVQSTKALSQSFEANVNSSNAVLRQQVTLFQSAAQKELDEIQATRQSSLLRPPRPVSMPPSTLPQHETTVADARSTWETAGPAPIDTETGNEQPNHFDSLKGSAQPTIAASTSAASALPTDAGPKQTTVPAGIPLDENAVELVREFLVAGTKIPPVDRLQIAGAHAVDANTVVIPTLTTAPGDERCLQLTYGEKKSWVLFKRRSQGQHHT